MEYYAHVSEDGRQKQLLRDHLQGVADLARRFAEEALPGNADFAEAAHFAGLLHDVGKYRDEFQDYLLRGTGGRSRETAHAVYAAAAAYFRLGSLASAFATAGHHAGLHDESRLAELIEGTTFKAQQRLPEVLRRAEDGRELGRLPSMRAARFGSASENDKWRWEFLTRMLFSVLVDADRLDAERCEQEWRLGRAWMRRTLSLWPDVLQERLEHARRALADRHPANRLNRLRNEVYEACIREGSAAEQGFFTLTVPTGGGKTLSSMAFALAHAKKHNLRRVIAVIPYLSIIEQNARQYRAVFGAAQVLEHHSAVEIAGDARSPRIQQADEPLQASEIERAMENWDVPIVVTTSVQFIETLFAASPARARRLHNVARSVVVFDEVQTLPIHLLEPTLDMLRGLRELSGTSLLFCSATQPAFRKSAGLRMGFESGEVKEIVPQPTVMYQSLRRVRYRVEPAETPWEWSRLAEEMLRRQQALCVVNLRRHAFAAWQALRERLNSLGQRGDVEDAAFHLSSAMCPAHRLDILGLSSLAPRNNIKARLKEGEPCWVISTQLIEAGVDIDFPSVFRAMGPLDSIVQSAGRCNREGLLRDSAGRRVLGEVIVFHPGDSGVPHGVYETATCVSPPYLLHPEHLATSPGVFAQYFSELYQLASTDHARKGEHTIQQDRANWNFRTVSKRARVIKEDTVSLIVPYRRAKQLVRQIRRTGRFDRNTLRRLQRYMVNVRYGPGSDYEKLLRIGALEPLLPERLEIPVLGDYCYDPQRGVVLQDRSLEDCIA